MQNPKIVSDVFSGQYLEPNFGNWIPEMIQGRKIQGCRSNYWCMNYFNAIILCLGYIFMENPKIGISGNFGVFPGFFGFQFLDSLELQGYITTRPS
jgi:hypothetical protein